MALKRKISASEFEKLPADIKTEYVSEGEGYKLDLVGGDDGEALQRALDRERQQRKEAQGRIKELENDLAEFGDKAKDIKTLTEAHKAETETLKQQLNGYRSTALKQKHDSEAMALAQRLNKDNPRLILPHIRDRLAAKYKEGSDDIELTILDKDGKPSKLTTDDVFKEFLDNKEFSSIVTGSKAQGSAGAGGQNKGSAFAPQNDSNQTKPLHMMNPAEMAAYITAKKENSEQ